eukprot:symbB.v1.2.028060.t2/scaffold2934.1/size84817/2
MAPKKIPEKKVEKPPEKKEKAKAAATKPVADKAADKASRRQAKEREEAEKQATLDAMMNPECDEESDEEEALPQVSGNGNFQPPERSKKKEAPEVSDALKEELRRQREERLAQREAERLERAPERKSAAKDLDAVLQKVAKEGEGKLSNKERRVYAKYLEKQKEEAEEQAQLTKRAELGDEVVKLEEELQAFTVSLPSGASAPGAVDLHLDRFSISAGGQRLFDDASLRLAKGRRYGLLGPNGMGKTTLLKHLAARKLPLPEQWSITLVQQEADATEVHVVDEVLASDRRRRSLLQREAELLSKLEADDGEGDASELQKLCEELTSVAQDLEALGAEAAEALARVRKILCGLGFSSSMMDGPVNVLSGGWRMRVSLAKALFLEPDLLLLDEPTNHLDLDAVLWLDEYLSEYSKTLLVVSHDADFLDSVCTDVVHLEEKKLIQYKGGYTEFRKAHTARVREREKEVKKQQEDKKAGKKVHQDEVVEKIKDYVVKFRFLPPRGDDRGGISVHDVDFSYTGRNGCYRNEATVAATRLAVLGPNGAGKSTLLNLLAKIEQPCKGDIVHSRGLTVCRYSQHFDEIAPALKLSAVEFLTSPDLRRFGAGTESPELAHKCLGQFGLPSHAHKRPMDQLSGGQKARVCFASITCRKPEILILDEPTNHLDIESVEALIDALKRFQGGLVLVSHDARLIQASNCDLWLCQAEQSLVQVKSFEDYRRQVLAELRRRQMLAEQEAIRFGYGKKPVRPAEQCNGKSAGPKPWRSGK